MPVSVLQAIDLARQTKLGEGFELRVDAGGTGRVDGFARGIAQRTQALTTTQYAPVKLDTRHNPSGFALVRPVTASTDQVLGICIEPPSADYDFAIILTSGVTPALVSGTINPGDYLYPTAAGRLGPTVTSAGATARALQSSSGDVTAYIYVDPKIPAQAFQTQLITMPYIMDNGGLALTTGIKGPGLGPFDFACTIEQWTLLADQSGSVVVDIWKDTYANYPPTVADTITASAKPTVSSAVKAQSSTLTGWTTAIAVGDILRFNIDSVTLIQSLTLSLKLRRV